MTNPLLQQPFFFKKKDKPVDVPIPLAPLADTHGHLTSLRKLDASYAIARAALVGVRLLVVPVDPADDVPDVPAFVGWFEQTIEAADDLVTQAVRAGQTPPEFEGYPEAPSLVRNVHFVAGVHPYGAQEFMEDPAVRERLEALLANERCLGVGEFGLDYGPWNKLPADVQMEAFRVQLRIAHEHNVPVELHIRDGEGNTAAHDDALLILQEEGVPQAGCDLHCFTSGPEVMRPFAELGCHMAFGGAATFARSEEIREAAAACAQGLILSETDAPYMAPVPLRGQECEPAMVAFSAARLAHVRKEALGITERQTYDALWRNALDFFGLR